MTPPVPAVTLANLETLIAREPFMQGYDLKVLELVRGGATIEIPYNPRFDRPGGVVSGPVLMTAADAAFWFAVMSEIGMETMAVTSELNNAFLRPAVREPVICKAKILKSGKKLIYGTAECMSTSGRLFSHHTVTYACMDKV